MAAQVVHVILQKVLEVMHLDAKPSEVGTSEVEWLVKRYLSLTRRNRVLVQRGVVFPLALEAQY
ncbi:MAG: hypothetical protein WAK60_08460 [Sedimentisphaerales bacterium]